MKQTVRLREIHQRHQGKVDFYWIYGQEARSSDTGLSPSSDRSPLVPIKNHRTIAQRKKAALHCAGNIGFPVQVLLDDLENSVVSAYQAHPTRLFVIRPDGTIGYIGGPGPFQTDLKAFEASLKQLSQ